MSTVDQKRITAEELQSMPDTGRCELVAGELRAMTPAWKAHGRIVTRISKSLQVYVEGRRVGGVSSGESGFLVARDPDTVRVPDVAVLSADQAADDSPGYYSSAPVLAIEVVSPSDRVQDVEEKAAMWLEAGAEEVWVVWPNTRTISRRRPGGEQVTLREQDTLESPELLPGFTCPVGYLLGLTSP